MSKLPEATFSTESMEIRKEAVDTVDQLLKRNIELEEIYDALQPLLYEMSIALYNEDETTISLQKLIDDGIQFIRSHTGVIQ